jgi:hypothetical protein
MPNFQCGSNLCCFQTGALGQPCTGFTGMMSPLGGSAATCSNGLACNGTSGLCETAGGDGQLCLEGSTCNSGLGCVDSMSGSSCPNGYSQCCKANVGGLGQACLSGQQCGPVTLACVQAQNGVTCPNGLSQCCKSAGGNNQPCKGDGSCNDHYACFPSMGTSSCGAGSCCQQPQFCSNGSCMPGMQGPVACITPTVGSPCKAGDAQCCLPTNGANQPCGANNYCNDGICLPDHGNCLFGAATCCTAAGADGQPCLNGTSCHSGLSCASQTPGTCPYGLDRCCHKPASCLNDGSCADPKSVCTSGTFCPMGVGKCCVAAGSAREPCISDPQGGDTCSDASLSCISLSMSLNYCLNSMGAAMSLQCCAHTGNLGEPCTGGAPSPVPTGTCNTGLACGATGTCVAAGSTGELCLPGNTCNSGLTCLQSWMFCPNNQSQCCLAAGGIGEPCLPDNTCNSGLACGPSLTLCPSNQPLCCLAATGINQPDGGQPDGS